MDVLSLLLLLFWVMPWSLPAPWMLVLVVAGWLGMVLVLCVFGVLGLCAWAMCFGWVWVGLATAVVGKVSLGVVGVGLGRGGCIGVRKLAVGTDGLAVED